MSNFYHAVGKNRAIYYRCAQRRSDDEGLAFVSYTRREYMGANTYRVFGRTRRLRRGWGVGRGGATGGRW